MSVQRRSCRADVPTPQRVQSARRCFSDLLREGCDAEDGGRPSEKNEGIIDYPQIDPTTDSQEGKLRVPIHLYYARPYQTFKFEDYLHYVRAVAEWIVFKEEPWPQSDENDPYIDGIVINTVGEQAAYNLAKWGKDHLKMPALVFIDKPISSIESTVPPTGFTHSKAPRISFATLTFGGAIPKDVVGLTVLHELLHMAHNLENPEGSGLVDGHCSSDRCVLNAKREGHFKGDVKKSMTFIRERGCRPCVRCRAILDKIKCAGHWS